MKGIITFILLLLASISSAQNVQMEVSDPYVTGGPNEYFVDINVTNFTNITSGEIRLNWPVPPAELIGIEDAAFTGLDIVMKNNGFTLTIPQGPGRTVPSGGLLCKIKVKGAGGFELCVGAGTLVVQGGSTVGIDSPDQCEIQSQLIQFCGIDRDTLLLSILVSEFEEVSSFQFSLTFDPDEYSYIDAIDLNPQLNGYDQNSVNNIDNNIVSIWIDPLGEGISLPAYSSLITFRFKIEDINAQSIEFGQFRATEFSAGLGLGPVIMSTYTCGELPLGVVRGSMNISDANCTSPTGPVSIAGTQIEFRDISTGVKSVSFTNADGSYAQILPFGEYEVDNLLNTRIWQHCQGTQLVDITLPDTQNIDFLFRPAVDCPYMTIDVYRSFLRRCFDNTYVITCTNEGTNTGEDAYVDIEIDPFMTYVSSTLPASEVSPGTYRVQLGDMESFATEQFRFTVNIDCDSTVLGQTHCVTGRIYPDTLCVAPDLLWSGASLETEAICLGDSVQLIVRNTGTAESKDLGYIIVEDDIGFMRRSHKVLPSQNITFTLPSEGQTWRIIQEQEPFHPGNSHPTSAIEGCNAENGTLSLGFVTAFSENDGDHFIDIDCQQSIGAYDPNDKLVHPTGTGSSGAIEPDQKLTYTIRFQNTGTDTAFTVRIIDSIPSTLDLSTFELISHSHPMEIEWEDGNILTFVFNNILLPDSTANEPESHGFVKFDILPIKDIQRGETINNFADIYFDFNAPIRTNTTLNTIAELIITNTEEKRRRSQDIILAPNPTEGRFTILYPETIGNMEVYVFDLSGRMVARSGQFERKTRSMDIGHLPNGFYILKLLEEGKLVGKTGLVLQK